MIQNWRSGSNIPLQKSSLKQQVSEREAAGSTCSNCLRGSPETGCYRDRRNPGGQEKGCSAGSAWVPPGSAAPLWPALWTEKTAFLQEDTEGGKGEADKACSKNGRGHRKPHTKDCRLQDSSYMKLEHRQNASVVAEVR